MLQITMAPGEYVMIGDSIKIYYDRLNSNKQLILSFEAPREIEIMRQRLYEEKLAREIDMNSPEGQQLARELQEAKEERERAAMLRAEKRRERSRIKKEVRSAVN